MDLKFYTGVAIGLKLKVRNFWELITTFAEVTGENLVEGGGAFCPPLPPPPSILKTTETTIVSRFHEANLDWFSCLFTFRCSKNTCLIGLLKHEFVRE